MKLGFIGLGRMGMRMVTKLLDEGHEVVVWNRSKDKIENLKLKIENLEYAKNLTETVSIADLVKRLDTPRIIWSMLPAGDATEQMLMGPEGIAEFVEAKDIVIDGANSFFEDTQRRFEYFEKKGILFLGIGVSGGVVAATEGYPIMVGGNWDAFDHVKPILDSLSKPNGGYEFFGKGGAGHFVKMVHNGIEYGYMQALGEGFGVMDAAPYDLDLVKVAKLYIRGTLVSGFMMERAVEALSDDSKLAKIEGYIDATGEGEWTIKQAKKEEVPIEIIEKSLEFRIKSREDSHIAASFAARMVAALRNVFGGHEIKRKS